MNVKKVVASRQLVDDRGKIALQRGPIIYCVEWIDNSGAVSDLHVSESSKFKAVKAPDMLGGITVLKGRVLRQKTSVSSPALAEFTAIPYYSWANRGKGEMLVWLPKDKPL